MLELLLLRHAKSRWDEPGAEDHERGLTPRGRKAATRMGRLLRTQGLLPDLVLCSTAVRARRTAERILAALDSAPPLEELRTLYLATPSRLLETVRRQAQGCNRLLVVGHNPGLHSLAVRLVGAGDPEQRALLEGNLPTAALVHVLFEAGSWSGVAETQGRLAGYWRPREMT